MRVSYSRVSTFTKCPFQYDLRYGKKLETIPTDDPQSPLILGHALHTGIEKDVTSAIEEYFNAYPIISDLHIDEAIKLEYLIPKVKEVLPEGQHEVKIEDEDFVGFIDLLVRRHITYLHDDSLTTHDIVYDIYDFKYSNNVKNYMDSGQLHLYKYYFEKLNPGKRIGKLYFVFIPKVQIRRKKKNKTNKFDETDFEFRRRILSELESKEIQIVEVKYNPNKVIDFLTDTKHLVECENFDKNTTRLCDWCEYQQYCEKGIDYMILPKNERRKPEVSEKKKIWLYAPPFSGKTTLTDKFPSPLILTTDGNIHNVTAPYIYIKDEVTVEGRMTKRKFAWEILKDTIAELEKKQNSFETISLDLVEDTREMCRLYMYDKLGIQHESDSSYGKGWDIIKTEYLSTMRRFFNLDYPNLIICSHEDVSKTLTKKSGEQITRIAPNIQEAIATKLAGMVDLVARIVVNADDTRVLSFKTDSVIFGGGRLNVKGREIPLDYDELMKVYDEANAGLAKKTRSVKENPTQTHASTATEQATAQTTSEDHACESLPKCPEGEKVFKEFNDGESDLCSQIDAAHQCHKEGGPDSCETVNGDEAKTEEKPVRRRRRRTAE